jgi:hypothetical protein
LLATYKALAFARDYIKILAKGVEIELGVVERNGAFKAMKIYTFVAEI